MGTFVIIDMITMRIINHFLFFFAVSFSLLSCVQKDPEIILPGQDAMRPNDVIINLPSSVKGLTANWFQNGEPMGEMIGLGENSFAATVSPYADNVTIEVNGSKGKPVKYEVDLKGCLDVQAHRGGAGLMPENTIEAMENAVRLGVNTLELDLHLSSDGVVVVSHDHFFSWRYCTNPDGSEIKEGDPLDYLYKHTYEEIEKYDTGLKPHPWFPDQQKIATHKPRAYDLIKDIEDLTAREGRSPMRYNIEVKSDAEEGEGVNWPDYKTLCNKCAELFHQFDLGDRLVIQCFDVRSLNYMHEKYPEFRYSYLIETKGEPWESFMGKLDFKPDWLSPEDYLVTQEMVDRCHAEGIKIVPWNPDDPVEMQKQIDMGIDALITNRPDILLGITRK